MAANRLKFAIAMLILAPLAAGSVGCHTAVGPNTGPWGSLIAYPVPISPYFQKSLEDDFIFKERYDRVPIMGPITQGGPPQALDPPSPDEVMRSLEKARPVQAGIPLLWTKNRNNVQIVPELIAEYVDPPRFYPLIGPAQHHHAHYKVTIFHEEVRRVGWPIPHTLTDEEAVEVIYIDHNHLHVLDDVDAGVASNY